MVCKDKWAQWAQDLKDITGMAAGSVDGAARCKNPDCRRPLRKDGTCVRGCPQELSSSARAQLEQQYGQMTDGELQNLARTLHIPSREWQRRANPRYALITAIVNRAAPPQSSYPPELEAILCLADELQLSGRRVQEARAVVAAGEEGEQTYIAGALATERLLAVFEDPAVQQQSRGDPRLQAAQQFAEQRARARNRLMLESLGERTVQAEYGEWGGFRGRGWQDYKELWLGDPEGCLPDWAVDDAASVDAGVRRKFYHFCSAVRDALERDYSGWEFRVVVDVNTDDYTIAQMTGVRRGSKMPAVVVAEVVHKPWNFYFEGLPDLEQDLARTYREAAEVVQRMEDRSTAAPAETAPDSPIVDLDRLRQAALERLTAVDWADVKRHFGLDTREPSGHKSIGGSAYRIGGLWRAGDGAAASAAEWTLRYVMEAEWPDLVRETAAAKGAGSEK